ncbi:MAG: sulfotransferase family protein [Gracilimonas sp.]|uniref:Sulfotransferase family protein n=1 Tax=Gracilimonas sediminicola TaxID=2952158 RepID=A0A9X2RC82_9BACT|nr:MULTISPECIES: sulfotransferase family protein [Gracilimonas]MBO6585737.1 sulfotransferase family protein [Gracilimonas sp.]MBO6616734.1 sulfotransferase family protein [Gracilimonas sp.]MCP9290666.1 sulfotransferase family protein [Gracilimonas sediminicola]
MLKTKRICLWSGPRNISTALMYSFAQRDDSTVFDEPLYAHYLANTDAKNYHPGADEVLKSQENDGQKVVDEIILGDYDTPIAFFKNMTHHLVNLDWSFLEETINVILTRPPKDMLPSYAKQVKNPTMQDVGYAKHLEVVKYLDNIGKKPLIVDSKDILQYPQSRLRELCGTLGIPFDEAMLKWPAGPRKEDGVWAKYWYHNVHRSTGFRAYKSKNEPFPEELEDLLEECQEAYDELLEYAGK